MVKALADKGHQIKICLQIDEKSKGFKASTVKQNEVKYFGFLQMRGDKANSKLSSFKKFKELRLSGIDSFTACKNN